MTLDQFAEITKSVIENQGFDEFQPSACFPERRQVKSLAGLPTDVEPEEPVFEWASDSAGDDEEFLVAFKTSEKQFRVLRRFKGKITARNYQVP